MKKRTLLIAILIMLGIAPIYSQTPAAQKSKTTHTKKDGTPDKRFKENKGGATSGGNGGPTTKKDGTPDMRYKSNKKK